MEIELEIMIGSTEKEKVHLNFRQSKFRERKPQPQKCSRYCQFAGGVREEFA